MHSIESFKRLEDFTVWWYFLDDETINKESENMDKEKQQYKPTDHVKEFLGRKVILEWSIKVTPRFSFR